MRKTLEVIAQLLAEITHPRLFENERAYQGYLAAKLIGAIDQLDCSGALVEQEYQKRIGLHGLVTRPDIIVHAPYGGSHTSRRDGNFIAFELKRRANLQSALGDYQSLADLCAALDYPMGIFINIGAEQCFYDQYKGSEKGRLVGFAVSLKNGIADVRCSHSNNARENY